MVVSAIKISDVIKYRKHITETVARSEENNMQVRDMESTVNELVEMDDHEAIRSFVEETMAQVVYLDLVEEGYDSSDAAFASDKAVMFDVSEEYASLSDDDISGDTISENDTSGNDLSGNDTDEMSDADLSGNDLSGNDISGNDVSGNDLSGNDLSGNDLSGNGISGNDVSSDNLSGDDLYGREYLKRVYDGEFFWGGSVPKGTVTLQQKSAVMTSYEETLLQNDKDRDIIEREFYDFSDLKIACLGDSLTEAINLEKLEDYEEYAFPAVLGRCLGAGEVVNLGIGGSSIGRYWSDPFVERYKEIPKDTDIIIVMGGTNDGFCVSKEEFGHLGTREKGTYIGDMDELMRGLKKNYPDALIVFATPLSNILHDYLRADRNYLLPQYHFAYAMILVAEEYDIPVIDLYDSNLLDSHDVDVLEKYKPDGVHCNQEGYEILGEHMAAELMHLMREGLYDGTEND